MENKLTPFVLFVNFVVGVLFNPDLGVPGR